MRQLLEPCDFGEMCAELGGSEKLLAELQGKLQAWLSLQPHLPQDAPEYTLKYFIIHTKFSIELAKQKLDMYYTVRRLVPEFFTNRDPEGPSIKKYHETTQWLPLPKLTPEKYRVTIYRKIDEDYEKFNLADDFKYGFMIGDVRLSECTSVGEVYVYDCANIGLSHITKITPAILKKADVVARKAYAARIKGIHFINVPPFLNRIVSMVKSVLSPKIAARVHVHSSNYESLYEFVPKSILPEDYGGDEVSTTELTNLWRKKLLEWRSWFVEQENVMVDESRRPGPMISGDDLFGFSGSFRKLEFD